PFDSPELVKAEFVSSDRLLTIGTNRHIYMYRLNDLSNPERFEPIASIGEQLGKDWGFRPDNAARIQWQVAFTADRRKMAIWNGDGYSFVNTTDGQEILRTSSVLVSARELWPRQSVKREQLKSGPVAFSPDGSVLAGVITHEHGSKDHILCLWDTRDE